MSESEKPIMQSTYRKKDDDDSIAVSDPLEPEPSTSKSTVVQKTDSSDSAAAAPKPQPETIRRRTPDPSPSEEQTNLVEVSSIGGNDANRPDIYRWLKHLSDFAICLFTLIICFLSTSGEIGFFSWHPILLSIGWMHFMYSSFLGKPNDSVLSPVTAHWIRELISMTLIITGCVIAYIHKEDSGKDHLTTWHGTLGLWTCLALPLPSIYGVVLIYHKNFKTWLNASRKNSQFFHIFTACHCLCLGGCTLILSIYSDWFRQKLSGSEWIFSVALVCAVYSVVWTVVRPGLRLRAYFMS